MPDRDITPEVERLLEEARKKADRYASAHYPTGEAKSGLGIRLEAIEAALLRLAAAADEKRNAQP
jgi:hypothetical protein